jgi:hypothetical protein
MPGLKGFSALLPTGGLLRPGILSGVPFGPLVVGGLAQFVVDIGLTSLGGLMTLGFPRLAWAVLTSLMGFTGGKGSFFVNDGGVISLRFGFLVSTFSGGITFLMLVTFLVLLMMVWLMVVLLMLVTLEM